MGNLGPYTCSLDAAMDVIGGKWKALILWALKDGPLRFGALRREVGNISEKMLIQHLKELQRHGIVHRESFHEVPPRVQYSMTPAGSALLAALEPLGDWAEANMSQILAGAAHDAD